MKHREKWLYLGFVPNQQVLRIPISDFQKRFELISAGWVFSTKEAWLTKQRFPEAKVFIPTTHAGITIYSHMTYTPEMINKIKNGSKKND